eukprot:6195146-Pleurochrysis_carterae.AAC.1
MFLHSRSPLQCTHAHTHTHTNTLSHPLKAHAGARTSAGAHANSSTRASLSLLAAAIASAPTHLPADVAPRRSRAGLNEFELLPVYLLQRRRAPNTSCPPCLSREPRLANSRSISCPRLTQSVRRCDVTLARGRPRFSSRP